MTPVADGVITPTIVTIVTIVADAAAMAAGSATRGAIPKRPAGASNDRPAA